MSQAPHALPHAITSTNFETIIAAALEEYKQKTKTDIVSHPLAVELKSCESPNAILAVLRGQVQVFDKSQTVNEKLTKWLDPTVNVLYAFSAILGDTFKLVIAIFQDAQDLLFANSMCHRYFHLRVRFLQGSVSSSK
jgi:hypothetical protein